MAKKKKLTRDQIDKDVEVITPAELSRHLLNAEYRLAKTYPDDEHWYTLRTDPYWKDKEDAFESCIKSIRVHGIQVQYTVNKTGRTNWYTCFIAEEKMGQKFRFFNIYTSARHGVLINKAVFLGTERTKALR